MKKTNTIFGKSDPGVRGVSIPKSDVPEIDIETIIDEEFIRKEPANLPEVSESELVRHYTNLSTKNYHIDKGFYPLGSCTMKLNAASCLELMHCQLDTTTPIMASLSE